MKYDRDRIIADMVGRLREGDLYSQQTRKTRPRRKEVLGVRNLSMGKVVRNSSFTIYAGQVTGMFGLVGSRLRKSSQVCPSAISSTAAM